MPHRRSCSTRGCHAKGRDTSRCCSTTRPTTCSRWVRPALLGAAIVGLNHTRREEHLLRDIEHTHCSLVITEPRHEKLLAPIAGRLPPVLTTTRFADGDDPPVTLGASFEDALAEMPSDDLGIEPDVDAIWALIFTSGTSSAPKAVICSQRRLLVTGNRMRMIMDLGPDDIGYVCMPLFHSSAVQVGWAPSLVTPCAVGLGRRFSASGWLPDIRRYGSTYFNYTGKPLAYLLAQPEQPDDADNTLRVAFGNEGSPEVVVHVRAAVRPRGDRRVRRDRRWRRGEPRCGGTRRCTRPRARSRADRRRGRQGEGARGHRCRGPRDERRGVCRRDRQHAGCRSVRGLLQQRRSDGDHDALRLVLVRRPRLQGRRRIPLLRRPQRRLDPRRRRELPRRTDRGSAAPRARRRARGRVRRARRPGRGSGHGRRRDRGGERVRSRRVRAMAGRAGRDRPEVAPALRAGLARPADNRNEQDREARARARQVPPRPGRR